MPLFFFQAAALGARARPPLALALLPPSAAAPGPPGSVVLDPGPPLAKGPHSTVWAGVLCEADGSATVPVVVKKPAIRSAADLAAFRSEVALLARAGGGRVARLAGARALPPDYWAAVPRAAGGSLADALDGGALARLHGGQSGGLWGAAARVGADVAAALARLHAAGVVHRDVKPGNVLLGRGLRRAWLGDLGVAVDLTAGGGEGGGEGEAGDGPSTRGGGFDASHPRSRAAAIAATLASVASSSSNNSGPTKPSGGHSRRHVVGTLEFLAPEVLMGGAGAAPAPPADVFALAVTVACAAACAAAPYRDATRDNPAAHTVLDFGYGRAELAAAVVGAGLRPSVGAAAPPALAALLEEAWAADPAARPGAAEVAARLRALVEAEFGGMGDSEDEAEPAWAEGESGAARVPLPPPPPPPTAAWTDPPWWPPPSDPAAFGDTTYTLVSDHSGASPSAPAAPPPPLVAGTHAQPGARGADRMEDSATLASPLPTAPGSGPGHLLAVFDGHRGAGAALYAAEAVVEAVRQRWCEKNDANTHPAAALAAAFGDLHAGWLAREAEAAAAATAAGRPPPPPAGATAVVALVWRDWLFVAGVGDARAVLVSADGASLRLTTDHVADDEGERARVVAAVGEAGAGLRQLHGDSGGWRLGAAGLAVTRALGDADAATTSGLTPSPTVTARRLAGGPARDACLILASDGLWDVVSDADAGGLVRDTVKDPCLAAKRLVHEALGRGSGDNVTAAVAFLRAESTCEAVFVQRE
jgi:serine/threonine protein phosphatase PrpC/serine/threonine protein kinase